MSSSPPPFEETPKGTQGGSQFCTFEGSFKTKDSGSRNAAILISF